MRLVNIIQGICLVVMLIIAISSFLLNIAPFVPVFLLMLVIMIAEGIRK